jgi:hypothetical protein
MKLPMVFLVVSMAVGASNPAKAQEISEPAAQQSKEHAHPVTDVVTFLAGGALGLVMHESGHLLFDAIFDADPSIKHVQFGPFPFFAITHPPQSPRVEFVISSAGFWVQEGVNEWLLVSRPNLRHEHAPLAKGVFAFNVLNSVGYGIVALFEAGPPERDTRGMSAIGVDERVIGAIVIAPAVLDAYRYFRPDSKWAKWASRGVKIGGVLLVLK